MARTSARADAIDAAMLAAYLRKSYFSVDGLWFLLVEEEWGRDQAFELDQRVWEILPKIQARTACELLQIPRHGMENFRKALRLKLEAEGYMYRFSDGYIEVTSCPWLDRLKRAGRDSIASDIAERICKPEFRVWFSEFTGKAVELACDCTMCHGDTTCVYRFPPGSWP